MGDRGATSSRLTVAQSVAARARESRAQNGQHRGFSAATGGGYNSSTTVISPAFPKGERANFIRKENWQEIPTPQIRSVGKGTPY